MLDYMNSLEPSIFPIGEMTIYSYVKRLSGVADIQFVTRVACD